MKKPAIIAVVALLTPLSLAAEKDWDGYLKYPDPTCGNKPTSGTITFYENADCTGSFVVSTFADANPGYFQICDQTWAPASAKIDLSGSCYDQCVSYTVNFGLGNMCGENVFDVSGTQDLCVGNLCD